jgi:probable rRNA maturation factor
LIDVEIEDDAWRAVLPDAERIAWRAAEAALAGLPSGALPDAALVVLLTGDDEVADLNLRFRGKPGPTNVLSFPAPDNPEGHLGDIALAYGVCRREAEAQNKPLEHHLQHLVVHGVLHLVGFDHMTDAEAVEMEGLERAVLAGLGTPDPYAAEQGEDG